MGTPLQNQREREILDYLKSLDDRIARIEYHLDLPSEDGEPVAPRDDNAQQTTVDAGESLEVQIGQTWFAKVGIGVFAIGIAFLLTLPYQSLPSFVPSVFGYVLVGAIMFLSYYWRETFTLVSTYLLGGAMVLLFFTTLRLQFFSASPFLSDTPVLVILLLAVVVVNMTISLKRKSSYFAGLSFLMAYATAAIADEPSIVFVFITLSALTIVLFHIRFGWEGLVVLGIVLSYLTHFLWAVNNPVLGKDVQLVSSPAINVMFVLLYSVIFGSGYLLRCKDHPEDFKVLLSAMLNGMGAYGLFLFLTLGAFGDSFVFSHLFASCVFLALATAFWIRGRSKYATFVYVMLGYLALSAAIIRQFGVPDNLLWLSWQTILVISTAVWFRSRFIIVANFVIYIAVFFSYLLLEGKVGIVSLSFGVIALLSARILNWQKSRLELRTEMMRNAYLASAFFVFPYSLYHTVPEGYVSLSWVAVAVFYYVASVLLKSHKYRWMALFTLIITVLHVFVADLTQLEPAYRIASFLVLGLVLLAISLIYSKRKSEKTPRNGEEDMAESNVAS